MDIDYLFYYGQVDEDDEVQKDILMGLEQSRRTMFYHRSFGSGIKEYENTPDGLAFTIGVKYGIASWIAARNQEVSDGSNGTRDRRVATSQSVILVEGGNGEKTVSIPYLRYADLNKPQKLVASI